MEQNSLSFKVKGYIQPHTNDGALIIRYEFMPIAIGDVKFLFLKDSIQLISQRVVRLESIVLQHDNIDYVKQDSETVIRSYFPKKISKLLIFEYDS